MFKNILQKDEEIVWEEGVNRKAFFFKNYLIYLVGFLIVAIFCSFFFTEIVHNKVEWNTFFDKNANIPDKSYYFTQISRTAAIIYIVLASIIITIGTLESKNTFFAITNKRIIKRTGIFNYKFRHYSLKNVGNVSVSGSIFDSKGDDGSATLVVFTKDFHNDTEGLTYPGTCIITSLNKGYKAYSILSEMVHGNNEVIRIKTEE